MGYRTSGPAPKRQSERVRVNAETIPTKTVDVSKLIQNPSSIPEANSEWHSVARMWYGSLAESAQCVYYEPSDWATAYVIADWLSKMLRPRVIAYDAETHKVIKKVQPMRGSDMAAFLKGATALLVTETDRLRGSIEVERAFQLVDETDASAENVVSFEDAQRRLRNESVGNG